MNIVTVNTLPETLAPSTLYFLRDTVTQKLSAHLTDKNGVALYNLTNEAATTEDFMLLINSLINQPNGIVGLDAYRNITGPVGIHAQNTPIRIDENGRAWRDMVANIELRGSNIVNSPNWGTFYGNFEGYMFSYLAMNQVWCNYHVDHDYAMGTNLYPHVHWSPKSTNTGTVRWGIEWCVAKGHDQEAFSAPQTIYLNHAVTSNKRYQHIVTECTDAQAIPGSLIEPDSFIKLRVFRDAGNSDDTFNSDVHAWAVDLHYQIGQLGTINKAPNFFGT